MSLPSTVLLAADKVIQMPSLSLPETTLAGRGHSATVLPVAPYWMVTPLRSLGRAVSPVTLVPI